MKQSVRVRFAPSPTGNLHIGGLRTAFFNWLLARHNDGQFLLRIEDTDLERSKEQYTEAIIQAFDWVGLPSDEPIVIQSSRIKEHMAVVEDLIKHGRAYYCYCTPEEVQARHLQQYPDDEFVRYDGFCRNRGMQRDAQRLSVVRFAIPDDLREIGFDDLIRGPIVFEKKYLDDFIIVRSDGLPVYNLVVVLDDAFMGITHIIRGEEHISNTPRQLLIYRACGYREPLFAHLPVILGPSGARLSKRDGATSVLDYRDNGYLPHALLNYLVRLGWAHGDQEKFTLHELISYFSLEQVSLKNAIFDIEKLRWLNAVYMREMSVADLWLYMQTVLLHLPTVKMLHDHVDQTLVLNGIALYKDRCVTVIELVDLVGKFLYAPSLTHHSRVALLDMIGGENAIDYLQVVYTHIDGMHEMGADQLKHDFKQISHERNVKLAMLAQPLRVALQGAPSGPGLFELMIALGKVRTVERIKALLDILVV